MAGSGIGASTYRRHRDGRGPPGQRGRRAGTAAVTRACFLDRDPWRV